MTARVSGPGCAKRAGVDSSMPTCAIARESSPLTSEIVTSSASYAVAMSFATRRMTSSSARVSSATSREGDRAARGRAEERLRIDDIAELARDPFEAARQAECAPSAQLLRAVVADGGAEDDEHEPDDDRFGDELRHRRRDPERDTDHLLHHARDDVDGAGQRDAGRAEPEHRERADGEH